MAFIYLFLYASTTREQGVQQYDRAENRNNAPGPASSRVATALRWAVGFVTAGWEIAGRHVHETTETEANA
jgi:hypothetical protein